MRHETSIRPLRDEDDIDWALQIIRSPGIESAMGGRFGRQLGSPNALSFQAQRFPGAIQIALCDGQRIGLVGLSEIDYDNRKANVWFTRDFEPSIRTGSMTDAVNLLCATAKSSFELKTVFAWANTSNRASHRVLERAKFRSYGTEPLGFYDGQEFVDLLWFNRVLA